MKLDIYLKESKYYQVNLKQDANLLQLRTTLMFSFEYEFMINYRVPVMRSDITEGRTPVRDIIQNEKRIDIRQIPLSIPTTFTSKASYSKVFQ